MPGMRDHHQYILDPISPTQTRFVQKDEVRGPLALILGHFAITKLLDLYQDFNAKLKLCAESPPALSQDPAP